MDMESSLDTPPSTLQPEIDWTAEQLEAAERRLSIRPRHKMQGTYEHRRHNDRKNIKKYITKFIQHNGKCADIVREGRPQKIVELWDTKMADSQERNRPTLRTDFPNQFDEKSEKVWMLKQFSKWINMEGVYALHKNNSGTFSNEDKDDDESLAASHIKKEPGQDSNKTIEYERAPVVSRADHTKQGILVQEIDGLDSITVSTVVARGFTYRQQNNQIKGNLLSYGPDVRYGKVYAPRTAYLRSWDLHVTPSGGDISSATARGWDHRQTAAAAKVQAEADSRAFQRATGCLAKKRKPGGDNGNGSTKKIKLESTD